MLQQFIAGGMPGGIVDLLEPVQVNEEEGEALLRLLSTLD
jgi:hypothetical protein